MQRLAELVEQLESSRSDAERLAAAGQYADEVSAADLAWALWLLAGGRLRPALKRGAIEAAARAAAGVGQPLFDACLQASGDWAETVALIVPTGPDREVALSHWAGAQGFAPALPASPGTGGARRRRHAGTEAGAAPAASAEGLVAALGGAARPVRRLMVLLAQGRLRVVGVDSTFVPRFLAGRTGLARATVDRRVADWLASAAGPGTEGLARVTAPPLAADAGDGPPDLAAPAAWRPWTEVMARRGSPEDWLARRGYGGLRARLCVARDQAWVIGPDGSDLSARLPHLVAAALAAWPAGTVADGELVAWDAGRERPAARDGLRRALQARPGKPGPAAEAAAARVRFVDHGLRASCPPIIQAPVVQASTWDALARALEEARHEGAQGLVMSRRRWPGARTGTQPGAGGPDAVAGWDGTTAWWWPAPPLSVRGVWMQALCSPGTIGTGSIQACIFGVWSRPPASNDEMQACIAAFESGAVPRADALQLVPVARVLPPLRGPQDKVSLEEQVRSATVGRFGPVRNLRLAWAADLVFDHAEHSARHKSGLVLHGARWHAWCPPDSARHADTLPGLTRGLQRAGSLPD